MFTGLIEEVGSFNGADIKNEKYIVKIGCKKVLEDIKKGDSIALNGMCVTVIDFGQDYFKADIMPESAERSSINALKNGSMVNLERALKLSDRMGGHMVSGHIDGTGKIQKIMTEKNATIIFITVGKDLARYIINKGSIAVDGTSLTVVSIKNTLFNVSLIPHTFDKTVLKEKKVGDIVNIECDIIGKYIEKFYLLGEKKSDITSGITMESLAENGFI